MKKLRLFTIFLLSISIFFSNVLIAQDSRTIGPQLLAEIERPEIRADEGKLIKQSTVVNKKVFKLLEKRNSAPVIIILKAPDAMSGKKLDIVKLQQRVREVQAKVLSSLDREDFKLVHQYRLINGIAGTLTRSGLGKLLADPNVTGIDLDAKGGKFLDESVPQIGAEQWHSMGVTGAGVVVAVLDTGIAPHPNLDDSVVEESCFLQSNTQEGGIPCPNGTGQQFFGVGASLDGDDHGSRVSGIITSNHPEIGGVAPDAEIYSIKVLDDAGTGQISDWIAGLEWVVMTSAAVDGPIYTRIVNMSLGVYDNPFVGNGDCEPVGTAGELMFNAVELLKNVDVTTFAASGNDGFSNALSFPACVSNIISVGSVTKQDAVVLSSNRNANLDIMAPGNAITSTGLGASGFITGGGTSFASPHVAGCAALLLEDDPWLTPEEVKAKVTNTNVFVTDNIGNAYPRLNCSPSPLIGTIGGASN